LEAAGADRSRIHALRDVPDPDGKGHVYSVPPSLPQDIPEIERVIRKHNVRLVVIDVLMAYLGDDVNSHRDQAIRRVLSQLAKVAEDTGAVFIMIRHLNKDGGGNAMYRGGGSIGIIGAARAAYLVARHPGDPEQRVLAQVKSNLGAEPPVLAYRLVSCPDYGCARVEWEPEPLHGLTANDFLHTTAGDDNDRTPAQEFIIGYLEDAGGTAPSSEVFTAGAAQGFSKRDLQNARKKLANPKVTTKKVGYGKDGSWVWSLNYPLSAEQPESDCPASLIPADRSSRDTTIEPIDT
jgi:hypothetical protein